MAPDRTFRLAKGFAWLGLFSIALFIITVVGTLLIATLAPEPEKNSYFTPLLPSAENIGLAAALVSVATSIVATVGAASTILLGWRAERRQSEEFKLKVLQLELQLEEARKKAASPGQT